MNGQNLYEMWCESMTTDRAHYFTAMNPADRDAWERLATRVNLNWEGSKFLDGMVAKAQKVGQIPGGE